MNFFAARIGASAIALVALNSTLHAQGVLAKWDGPAMGALGDVAAAGDINGDAVVDLAYTQPKQPTGGLGRLIVRSGVDTSILLNVPGLAPDDGFGSLLEALGDVNGDGRGDLLVAATAYLACISGANGAVLWQVQQLGVSSITDLPDLDLDGARDWAFGAPSAQFGVPGVVQVHSGRTGAVLFTIAPPPNASRYFGSCVAPAGDFDLDGNQDLLVGDPNGGSGDGSVSVHGTTQPGITGYVQGAPSPFGPFSPWFGASVATPGDVDGDAVPDLLVGSPAEPLQPWGGGYEGGPTGKARLISGASGLTLFDFTQFVNGNGFGSLVDTYPDLDGDGQPELLISAAVERIGCCHYLPGELRIHSSRTGLMQYYGPRQGAERVAAVRDLNGDGFAELLMADSAPSTRLVLPFVPPPDGIPGCVPKLNSKNCIAWLDFSGSPSLSMGDDLRLNTYGLIHASVGLILFARQPATLPFGGGILCVGGTIRRSAQFNTGGTTDCGGAFALDISKSTLGQLGGAAGSVLYAQAWYRDSGFAAPNDIGLSTGLAITLWP